MFKARQQKVIPFILELQLAETLAILGLYGSGPLGCYPHHPCLREVIRTFIIASPSWGWSYFYFLST
ncbi:MAG TPA: hypothetical protein DF774_07445 [Rheinheimera sp.]|nr:hypothetical protein [Rheinheimera sp.]